MELFHANRQWATRPADERFWNLDEMMTATRSYAQAAREATVPFADLKPVEVNGEVLIAGPTGKTAAMTNFSFKQMCARAEAPPSYLATLPPSLVVENLSHGLAKSETTAILLLHPKNGDSEDLILRAATSDQYERFWNYEVISRLRDLEGWRTPPARPAPTSSASSVRLATEQDVIGGSNALSVRVGDPIAPAGLYASDHDMFAFLISDAVIEDGTDGGLRRGVMVSNSEVGDGSLWIMGFLFRSVCGNHIVWGAKDVFEFRVAHRGEKMREQIDGGFSAQIKTYLEASSAQDSARIVSAKNFSLGKTKDEVLDLVFGKRFLGRKAAVRAYELAETHPEDGDPRTAWGFAQGVTRLSQETEFADVRVETDRAAGRILSMAF